jgi:hypothetical protein
MQQEPLQSLLGYPVFERRLRCEAHLVLPGNMSFGRNPFRPRICSVVTVYFARLEQVFASSVVYPLPPLAA